MMRAWIDRLARLYRYVVTGSDAAASPLEQADNDRDHAAHGLLFGLIPPAGLAYIVLSWRKQRADALEPGGARDARIDLAVSIGPTLTALAAWAAIAWLAWPVAAALSALLAAAYLAALIWATGRRGV